MAEKECFTAIRHSQMEMVKLSEKRTKEEQHVKLEKPIYEMARDRCVGWSNHAAHRQVHTAVQPASHSVYLS